jgi:hypothetical protein
MTRAENKSLKLFMSLLTADERKQWDNENRIVIKPKRSRTRKFVISDHTSQTVETKGDNFYIGWCAYADMIHGSLPKYDHMAAKYLALKCNLKHFRANAALAQRF